MSEQKPPKIEFPCENYPIKVLGNAGPDLYSHVIEVMEFHAPGFDQTRITINDSSKGRFQSLTVWITALGVEQLSNIHYALRASENVKMVL